MCLEDLLRVTDLLQGNILNLGQAQVSYDMTHTSQVLLLHTK